MSVSNPGGSGVRVAHGDSSGTVTLTLSGERSDHRRIDDRPVLSGLVSTDSGCGFLHPPLSFPGMQ